MVTPIRVEVNRCSCSIWNWCGQKPNTAMTHFREKLKCVLSQLNSVNHAYELARIEPPNKLTLINSFVRSRMWSSKCAAMNRNTISAIIWRFQFSGSFREGQCYSLYFTVAFAWGRNMNSRIVIQSLIPYYLLHVRRIIACDCVAMELPTLAMTQKSNWCYYYVRYRVALSYNFALHACTTALNRAYSH